MLNGFKMLILQECTAWADNNLAPEERCLSGGVLYIEYRYERSHTMEKRLQEVPLDHLTAATADLWWEDICYELARLGVPLGVQPTVIQRASECASSMAAANSRLDRKILAMVLLIKVIDLPYADDMIQYADVGSLPGNNVALMKSCFWIKLDKSSSRDGCAICLERLPIGAMAVCTPCSHIYHEGCIIPWLRKSNTCPFCRFQLRYDVTAFLRRAVELK